MISIIGAGPSGSYLAYLLARKGKDVSVFEEHDEIGMPIQCTGLVTSSIKEYVDLPASVIVNTIREVRVYAPNGESVDFHLKEPNYVLNRASFDNYLADLAKKNGAKYFLGKKFTDFKDNKIFFHDKSVFETDFVVGADGPMSAVAKKAGLFHSRKFMTGMQVRAKGKFEKEQFVVYLGEGYFGWSVPENSSYSRVGVIAADGKPKVYFDEIMKKVNGTFVEYQSGLIPLYQPGIKCQKDNVYLLGDAATQCKGSTHGGIIQGMIAATALRDAILTGKFYDRLWKKRLRRDLYVHLLIRKKIDSMKEKDLNLLIKLVNKEKVKNILEAYDRDFASKIVFKTLINEPRFLKLAI